jgi:hypothetical protein
MNHQQHGYEKPARDLPAVRIFGDDWRIRMIEEPEPDKHLQLQSPVRLSESDCNRFQDFWRTRVVTSSPFRPRPALRLFLWNTSQQLNAKRA